MNKNIQNSLTEAIIRESAMLFDTPFDTIKKVGGFENFVFEYRKNDEEFIMRFVHSSHRSENQVYAELEFIDYLDKYNARVSTVVHSINENLLEVIRINDSEYFIICVFEKAPGGTVKKEDLTDEFYIMFGEEVGRMHALTKKYNPNHKRIHWDQEPLLEMAQKCLPKKDKKIEETYLNLVKRLQKLPKNDENYGLIHTDLHFGNMFISSGELTFFDWDDSAYKHFISDIAIVIFYHFCFYDLSQEAIDEGSARILDLFLKGYRRQNSIDVEFLSNLNDFLMLRTIILYIVIYDAGEELIDSVWGKQYLDKYRDRIIGNIPFLTLDKVLVGL